MSDDKVLHIFQCSDTVS